ncbi:MULTISPECIES: UvrD-helicase domain-containing protein [unclassified Mycobacteroides]|uniref:UvrD-helicase domain-containing protein n=1 Tax=unclassified Mycobacteroides TaxID=2618759 RepID=UPI001325867D|nr:MULTISPECIES: UvrD-helicase domain-containing protein [unclassified Mycobacteroides]MUM18867.1 hypothetical protein [Mycobacteroides sp. CBMA 326]
MTEPFVANGPEQQQVISTEAQMTVVLGGAGTGKSTCALAAARAHLERATTPRRDRALFLSFSRAAVARLIEHSGGILGEHAERVDVLTFHALSYSIVRRFGSLLDQPGVVLVNKHCAAIRDLAPHEIGYDDLHPMAREILEYCPAAKEVIQNRWSLIIVDEFQDTDSDEEALLALIAVGARRILLGDPNQCIYADLPMRTGVRVERILEACTAAGSANVIALPTRSHRDPTDVIPLLAQEILNRRFNSKPVIEAIDLGRLKIWRGISANNEIEVVDDAIQDLRAEGHNVAVFTHHVDTLAKLADGLEKRGIPVDVAGLSDALSCALDAQVAMLKYAVEDIKWEKVLEALGIFVISAQRGKQRPPLVDHLVYGGGSAMLWRKLTSLRELLELTEGISELMAITSDAHRLIGLPAKISAWERASLLLRPMRARAARQLGTGAGLRLIVRNIAAAARETSAAELTLSRADYEDPERIQLMNLYQTKGREADATVIILREDDFMGKEREPFPNTSRLLYVVFTRARKRIVVLLIGNGLPPAVTPLLSLAHWAPHGRLPAV